MMMVCAFFVSCFDWTQGGVEGLPWASLEVSQGTLESGEAEGLAPRRNSETNFSPRTEELRQYAYDEDADNVATQQV